MMEAGLVLFSFRARARLMRARVTVAVAKCSRWDDGVTATTAISGVLE